MIHVDSHSVITCQKMHLEDIEGNGAAVETESKSEVHYLLESIFKGLVI